MPAECCGVKPAAARRIKKADLPGKNKTAAQKKQISQIF
jgi:hypothetical protein